MPVSFSVSYGAILPCFFAIGAAIPVFIIIRVIAFSYTKLYKIYNRLQKFELWFRRVLGVLLILSGVLFIAEYYC
jgi:cytochrome c biogenesis protein CcdA